MPANDRPPAATAEEETPAADADQAAAPAAGGFKAWLPLIATLLVMPALAWVMTSFVLLPKLQKGLGIAPSAAGKSGHAAKPAPNAKKEYVSMNKLVVNVAGTMGSRYLLVSLSLVSTDPDFKTRIQEQDPELRDMAGGALRQKTLADLEKAGASNLIRAELISGFNKILGAPLVQEIYFTEFAIQ